jgi:hypothetical protein
MTDYPKVSRKEFQEAIEAGIKHFMFHPKELGERQRLL